MATKTKKTTARKTAAKPKPMAADISKKDIVLNYCGARTAPASLSSLKQPVGRPTRSGAF